MLIEKAIISLLKFNNRVTIPNLGSIIKQADFSQALFFNQFIRFDDGLLLTHLIKVEDCTQQTAEEEIWAFNRKVNEEIRAGGSCWIDGVGYFTMQDGRIEIVADQENSAREERAYKPEMPVDREAEAGERNGDDRDDDNSLFESPVDDQLCFDENTEETVMWRQRSNYVSGEPVQTKSKLAFGIGMAAVISFLIATAGYVLFFRDGETSNSVQPATSASQNIGNDAQKDSATTNVPETETAVEVQAHVTEVSQPPSSSYHIIVGSFMAEANAERLTSMLNHSGVPAVKLPRLGKFFMVSFCNYHDLQAARKNCTDLRRRYDGAWIIKIN